MPTELDVVGRAIESNINDLRALMDDAAKTKLAHQRLKSKLMELYPEVGYVDSGNPDDAVAFALSVLSAARRMVEPEDLRRALFA